MIDLIQDTVWQKANSLVQEKYGKSLSYRSLKLITDNDKAKESEPFYTSGDDLIIPLKLKNYDLGDVVVGRGSFLDEQQIIEIVDLIKFLIEPKLYNLQLKKSEDNLLSINTKKLSLVDQNRVVELYHSEKFRKHTLSQIILLKSHTELIRSKVALKIHEMAERNFFVHLDDIIKSLSSKEDLKTLNDTTIYIKDIQLLSKDQLTLLEEFLKLSTTDGPLFLVGSSLSQDGIEAQEWPKEIKKDLQGFYFDIDRVPLSQQTSEEILELLFFQLDSIIS
jgi:hypothetical protein